MKTQRWMEAPEGQNPYQKRHCHVELPYKWWFSVCWILSFSFSEWLLKAVTNFKVRPFWKLKRLKSLVQNFIFATNKTFSTIEKPNLQKRDWICCSSFVHLKIFEDPLTLKWSCCCRILYNVNCCRKLLKHVFLGFLAISIIAEIVKKRLERAPQQNE